MKVLFINATEKIISEVEINGEDTLHESYRLIGCELVEAPIIFDEEDTIYVDEEGLYKDDQPGFQLTIPPNGEYKGSIWEFSGNGIVLGTDEEGNSISPKMGIEYLASMIEWRTIEEINTYRESVL